MIFSPIDEIKNRLDIVEVIGSYIKLQKTGVNFRAVCPFHSEKKPSFFVSPARQIWHCFGCSKGGSIFNFVMEIEGMEFGDALRILAQKAGIDLKPIRPELKTQRARLYEICELSARFFEKQLEGSRTGKEAKEYLLGRGIKGESIKKWRVGYSPDIRQGLSDFLVGKGYKRDEVVTAGLSASSAGPEKTVFDRFRSRIMFPIFDLQGQVIGFGGRIFGEKAKNEIAKYVNTPNTLLYDKSRVLYGLDRAKMAIRKKDSCILVEGYTDVIMVSQAGYENVVATSGTALTPYQLKILKRYSENLITAFDMDVAGDSATKRGIDLAQAQGFNIKVLLLSEDSDPADIISKNPAEWQKALENLKSILDFYFDTTFSRHDSKTPEGKKAVSRILLPVIKRIPNSIERSFWVQALAKKLEVKEEDVAEELKKTKLTEEIYGLEPEEIINLPPKTRKELLEERLITLILIKKSPGYLEFIRKEDIGSFAPSIQEIFKKIKENLIEGPELDVIGLSPELANLLNCLSLKAEIEEIEEKEILPEIRQCLKEIQSLEIKEKLDRISKEIKKAEEARDVGETEKLIREFNKHSKSRSDLECS